MKSIQNFTKIVFIYILISTTTQVQLQNMCRDSTTFNQSFQTELGGHTLEQLFTTQEVKPTGDNIPIFLGNGAHGATYSYIWGGKKIAIKVIKKFIVEDTLSNLVEELKTGYYLNDVETTPNYYECAYLFRKMLDKNGTERDHVTVFILQELMDHNLDNRELITWLKGTTIDNKGAFYKSLFQALGPIHNKGISHNDIKPDNIMIGQNPDPDTRLFSPVKIIDFGLSEDFGKGIFHSTICYDLYKREGDVFDEKFDIYAMAISIAEMETNFDKICGDWIDKKCIQKGSNEKASNACLQIMKNSMYKIMNPIFETPKPASNIFHINECIDYGCILLSIIKSNSSKVPTLENVLKAFDNVANHVEPIPSEAGSEEENFIQDIPREVYNQPQLARTRQGGNLKRQKRDFQAENIQKLQEMQELNKKKLIEKSKAAQKKLEKDKREGKIEGKIERRIVV